jgi:hypothetical protein
LLSWSVAWLPGAAAAFGSVDGFLAYSGPALGAIITRLLLLGDNTQC